MKRIIAMLALAIGIALAVPASMASANQGVAHNQNCNNGLTTNDVTYDHDGYAAWLVQWSANNWHPDTNVACAGPGTGALSYAWPQANMTGSILVSRYTYGGWHTCYYATAATTGSWYGTIHDASPGAVNDGVCHGRNWPAAWTQVIVNATGYFSGLQAATSAVVQH